MKKKMGCGALAGILIVVVILVLLGANEAFGYYLSHCDTPEIIDCLMDALEDDEPEPEPEGAVTATGEYSYKGYSVTVSATVPLAGGAVTGTVTGTCEGKINGNFDGKNGGSISGSMGGGCSPFIVNVPASATFGGTVNKTSKTIPVSFSGKGAGIKHDGSMTLSW